MMKAFMSYSTYSAYSIKKILLYILYISFISWIWLIICLAIIQVKEKYPITKLKISGQLDYIAPLEIESKIADLLNNNLWVINVSKIRDKLCADPWIQDVFVNKLWPDVLQVNVVQHNPIAKWNEQYILSSTGLLLPLLNRQNLDLPIFYGQAGQENMILETYLMLLEKLTSVGLFISKLAVMPDHSIQLTLSNGIVLKLGTSDISNRINRFIIIYKKKLQPIISDVSYVDLRYTNGVAVGWAQKGGS